MLKTLTNSSNAFFKFKIGTSSMLSFKSGSIISSALISSTCAINAFGFFSLIKLATLLSHPHARTSPESDSSPRAIIFSALWSCAWQEANTESAMHNSKCAPHLGRAAGKRLIVTFRAGQSNPELITDARKRSLLS